MKKSKKYKDESVKHEGMESKSMEGRETMLEKKRIRRDHEWRNETYQGTKR